MTVMMKDNRGNIQTTNAGGKAFAFQIKLHATRKKCYCRANANWFPSTIPRSLDTDRDKSLQLDALQALFSDHT